MPSQDLNYFTCTLGQAAQWKNRPSTQQPNQFSTVLELIDDQGKTIPDAPAIGFADFSHDDGGGQQDVSAESTSGLQQMNFKEMKALSQVAATELVGCLGSPRTHEAKSTVGLLCASSLDFILTWLGLMRLGYTVFLLAPQLEEKAIEHLCSNSGAETVFADRMYRDKVKGLRKSLRIVDIPSYSTSNNSCQQAATKTVTATTWSPKASDVAYLRHTSGTSSGLPKPIRQSHWGAVGVLPRLSSTTTMTGERPATFSTTPLYHGGLADCFRAWAAGAMIWFFPETVAPVTGANVVKAVQHARRRHGAPAGVSYFTSVPYVLQMLSESREGVRLLQSMDLVGVGGAALPAAVGDKLVGQDVKLVSRMGSAECGFLLSSERDYAQDKEWQFLRPPPVSTGSNSDPLLAFEPRGDELSELVARPSWPLLAQVNRADGSYATADLFEPHPSIPDAWRYHSRADAQITLANAKKFDPSPLESAILASTPHLRDVLIFGGARDYPGALLFPSDDSRASESEVVDSVWPSIQKLNQDAPSHARLSKAMLLVVLSGAKGGEKKSLPKSSKGTIMRRQAEEQYGDLIETAYEGSSGGNHSHRVSEDGHVPSAIAERFAQVLGRDLVKDQDVYGQGVDSIACIQIRKAIERDLLPEGSGTLPINIIYDCGTINELVDHVLQIRQQQKPQGGPGRNERDHHQEPRPRDSDLALMRDMVQQHSNFGDLTFRQRSDNGPSGITVLLTGATGALGAHIVHSLLQDRGITRIYCLLRAHSPAAAHERVSQALSKRGLPSLEAWDETRWLEGRIVCLPSDLSRPDLGLDAPRGPEGLLLGAAAAPAVVMIHAAWAVNFSLRLGSFQPHLAATENLVRLAAAVGARFYFVSSTAAVVNHAPTGGRISETISTDPADASPLGYSRSKWVAENICAAAYDRYISDVRQIRRYSCNVDVDGHVRVGRLRSPSPLSIIRVGQLFANHLGIWNESEAYPLMLSTASFTGCLPDLGEEPLNWLPVELGAQAVIEIAIGRQDDDSRETNTTDSDSREVCDGGGSGRGDDDDDRIPVYHVLNPHIQPTWREMLKIITSSGGSSEHQQLRQGVASFETVPPSVWVKRLEASLASPTSGHSSQALLDLWKGKYPEGQGGGGGAGSTSDDGEMSPNKSGPAFARKRTEVVSSTMRDIRPLDRARIVQMWNRLQKRQP